MALAVAVASPLLVPGTAWSAGLERASDALASLAQRSPGERTSGELIKVKHPRQHALSPEQIVERALGKEFPPERVIPGPGEAFPSPAELLDSVRAPAGITPFAGNPKSPATSGALAGFVPPTVVRGRGNPGGDTGVAPPGGGGGGGTGDVGPTPLVVVPPAVPEPDTWATMILGLGLCAWSLRRRAAGRQGPLCAAA